MVCMVALEAMQHGMRYMYSVMRQGVRARGEGQSAITEFFPPAAPGALVATDYAGRAAAKAVDRFWELLKDFVAVGAVPERWVTGVGPSHPIVGVCGAGEGKFLVFNRPAV